MSFPKKPLVPSVNSFSGGMSYQPPNPQMPYSEKGLISTSVSGVHPLSKSSQKITKSPIKKTAKLPPIGEDYPSIKTHSSFKEMHNSEKSVKYENIIESFLLNTMAAPLSTAIEESLIVTLNASSVTFWQDIPSLHLLYSSRLSKSVSHSSGLVGYTFFSRQIVKAERACAHVSYSDEIDTLVCPGQTPVILFPLWDYENNVCAVVEVTRKPKDPFFNEDDEAFIMHFTKKFKIYSNWLYHPQIPHDLILELLQVMELEQFLLLFQRRIPSLFRCTTAELWCYDYRTMGIIRYDDHVTSIEGNKTGIVGDAMNKGSPINSPINKMMSSYDCSVDGEDESSILVVPVSDAKQNKKWAVCLRGSLDLPIFTSSNENLLRAISPYLVTALDNADRFTEAGHGTSRASLEHQCIAHLQKSLSLLSEGVPIKQVYQESLDGMQQLSNSDRAYLFQFNTLSDQFESIVANGAKEKIIHDKDKGIVAKTFRQKETFNIPDINNERDYDISADLAAGYKTKSLLSMPLLNNRRESVAVAQFVNRKDRKPFSNIDIGFVQIFGQFCGLIIENETLYNIASNAQLQLENLMMSAQSLNVDKTYKVVLTEMLHHARDSIGADRSSLFLHDDVLGVLTSFIVDGTNLPLTIPLSHGIAATAVNQKMSLLIKDPYHDPRFNKMIDFHSGYSTTGIIAAPIITTDNRVLGVIEMLNRKDGPFTKDHVKLIESYASIASIVLESKRLKDITEKGNAQVEMSKWIGEYEKSSSKIPVKLQLPPQKQEELLTLSFFADDWNGIGLFKIAFFVFDSFGLLEQFHITNELFFTFLYRLRERYNEPPYHNWIHAIDVLQYVSYQVHRTKVHNILTKFELLAVCVAAISHDANHKGLNNPFNVNAQTPLGILFKDRSVMETHHCSVLIDLISHPECNILHALGHQELQTIWKWIIHLIQATDMALHFKLIKQADEVLEQKALNLKEESHRLMAMELIMKVSDISNVSRPFKYADMWADVLQEEFYKQGDLEQSLGLDFSSPLNNRKGQNKAKGQVGFYTHVCVPLYSTISRIFPELQVNLDSMKSNLEKWKQLVAEQEVIK